MVKSGDAESEIQALDRLFTGVAVVDILASPPVSQAANAFFDTLIQTEGQDQTLLRRRREEFLRAAQEELSIRMK
jgi:hypothetical protein